MPGGHRGLFGRWSEQKLFSFPLCFVHVYVCVYLFSTGGRNPPQLRPDSFIARVHSALNLFVLKFSRKKRGWWQAPHFPQRWIIFLVDMFFALRGAVVDRELDVALAGRWERVDWCDFRFGLRGGTVYVACFLFRPNARCFFRVSARRPYQCETPCVVQIMSEKRLRRQHVSVRYQNEDVALPAGPPTCCLQPCEFRCYNVRWHACHALYLGA